MLKFSFLPWLTSYKKKKLKIIEKLPLNSKKITQNIEKKKTKKLNIFYLSKFDFWLVWLPKWFWMFGFWNGWARRCCWACDTFVFFSKSKQTKYTESFQKRQNDCYFCTVWYFVTLYINAYVLTSFHLSKKKNIVTKEKTIKNAKTKQIPANLCKH